MIPVNPYFIKRRVILFYCMFLFNISDIKYQISISLFGWAFVSGAWPGGRLQLKSISHRITMLINRQLNVNLLHLNWCSDTIPINHLIVNLRILGCIECCQYIRMVIIKIAKSGNFAFLIYDIRLYLFSQTQALIVPCFFWMSA